MSNSQTRHLVSHYKIFEYWKDKCITEHGEVYIEGTYDYSTSVAVIDDWGEPCCWACRKPIYVEKEKRYLDWLEDGDLKSIYSCNTLKKSVERAHIIPHVLGGTDEADNLFLLCKDCHEKSPDLLDKRMFLKWVYKKRKKPSNDKFTNIYHSIEEAFDILKEDYSINNPIITDDIYDINSVGVHGSEIVNSTYTYMVVSNALKNQYKMRDSFAKTIGC